MAGMFGLETLNFGGAASQIGTALQWILFICVLAGLAYVVYVVFFKFKHRVIVRVVTGTTSRVEFDKAATVKKKDGTTYWRLQRRRDNIPIPPSESISLTNKGKFIITLFYTEQGEYVFVKTHFDKDLKIGSDDPLTTADREFYVNQIRKSEEERGFRWDANTIATATSVMGLIILVTLSFVFWGDIVEPAKAVSDNFATVTAKQAEIQTDLNDILLERQRLQTEGAGGAIIP